MRRAPDPASALAAEVARAARRRGALRVLLLDLDGTLAPIVARPEDARVPIATLEALRRLGGRGWRLAIVSGRPAAQLRRLVPVRGIRAFGSHGREGSWNGRGAAAPPAALRRRVAALIRAGRRLARGVSGVRVEVKPAGVAFHDRGVAASQLGKWRRRLRRFLRDADLAGLELLSGRRVVEIRPLGSHKGLALRGIAPPRGERADASLVGIGDDRTDEDLFRALRGRGLGVRVGRPSRRTHANRRLPSPRAVQRFLQRLADAEGKND